MAIPLRAGAGEYTRNSSSATARKYGEHKFSCWRGCVDSLFAADEFHLFLGQPFHEVKQVARASPAKRLIDSTIYRIARGRTPSYG